MDTGIRVHPGLAKAFGVDQGVLKKQVRHAARSPIPSSELPSLRSSPYVSIFWLSRSEGAAWSKVQQDKAASGPSRAE